MVSDVPAQEQKQTAQNVFYVDQWTLCLTVWMRSPIRNNTSDFYLTSAKKNPSLELHDAWCDLKENNSKTRYWKINRCNMVRLIKDSKAGGLMVRLTDEILNNRYNWEAEMQGQTKSEGLQQGTPLIASSSVGKVRQHLLGLTIYICFFYYIMRNYNFSFTGKAINNCFSLAGWIQCTVFLKTDTVLCIL